MNNLEYAINRTMDRMTQGAVYSFAKAIPLCDSWLTGASYPDGPVLLHLIFTAQHNYTELSPYDFSKDRLTGIHYPIRIKESDFVGTYQRLGDRRIQNPSIGLY